MFVVLLCVVVYIFSQTNFMKNIEFCNLIDNFLYHMVIPSNISHTFKCSKIWKRPHKIIIMDGIMDGIRYKAKT
jgi:hypothetical protein